MTKTLSVYLNAKEHKLLTALQEALGFSEESKVVKAGLVALANGQHNGHELRVEIPRSMQIKGFIRQLYREIDKEKELAKIQKAVHDKEEADRLWGLLAA